MGNSQVAAPGRRTDTGALRYLGNTPLTSAATGWFWRLKLDFADECVRVQASVVGKGEGSRSLMKNSNNEPMNPTKSGIDRTRASVVPTGRTCFGAEFPGTLCLANFRCRFATLPNRGEDVGEGGKRWVWKRVNLGKGGQKAGKWRSFSHFETAFSHLFPCFSTQVVDFPRMTVVSIFWEGTNNRRGAETQSQEETGTKLRGLPEPSGAWNQDKEAELV